MSELRYPVGAGHHRLWGNVDVAMDASYNRGVIWLSAREFQE